MRINGPEEKLARPMVICMADGERLGLIERKAEVQLLRDADPLALVYLGRHPVAFLQDKDAWLTLQRRFRLADYMSDDYAYRQGIRWEIASPSARLPRGVCIFRAEAKSPVETESTRRDRRAVQTAESRHGGKAFRFRSRFASYDGRDDGREKQSLADREI